MSADYRQIGWEGAIPDDEMIPKREVIRMIEKVESEEKYLGQEWFAKLRNAVLEYK